MSKNDDFVKLGECRKPHGIKGGFLFHLYNSESSVLKKGAQVKLLPLNPESTINKNGQLIEIETIHFGNKTICYLKNIKSRNTVEAMIPFEIHFPRSLFPELDDSEVYVSDLVGLDVYNQAGDKIGKVDSYFDNGAQVCLKILMENKKFELPFVEAFFPEVDLENKKIVMVEPEYDE